MWERDAQMLDLYLHGRNCSEIGKYFGISRGNAKIRIHKAAYRLAYRVFHGLPWRQRYGSNE